MSRYRGRLRSALENHDKVIFDQIRVAERALRRAMGEAERMVRASEDPSERYRATRTLRDVRGSLASLGGIRPISPFGSGSEMDTDLMIEPPPFEKRKKEPEVAPEPAPSED